MILVRLSAIHVHTVLIVVPDEAFYTLTHMVSTVCKPVPSIKTRHVEPQWAHVKLGIDAMVRCKQFAPPGGRVAGPFGMWFRFGMELEFESNMGTFWADRETQLIQQIGHSAACNSVRCPLHENAQPVRGKPWLRCTRCRKASESVPSAPSRSLSFHQVEYCSIACQRLDWKEGGHRASCRMDAE